MALIFNSYLKGQNGIINLFNKFNTNYSYGRLLVYPSTVAFPSSCPASNAYPGGAILQYALTSSTFSVNSSGVLLLNSPYSANTTAAGTLSWWMLSTDISQAGYYTMIGDSVGLTGTTGIVTLSTLTPTSGQSVTWSTFNLVIV